jgi:hypothetical protein
VLLADLPVPQRDGEEARRAIERILARPEFAEDQRTFLERARDWVFDRLADLFDALAGSAHGGVGSVVAWAIAIALAGVAIWLTVRLTRSISRSRTPHGPGDDAPLRPAEDWRADAEAAEAAGDWRLALRCRYRALVADLAARGLVEEVPGRTAGEYRRQVGHNVPTAAPEFSGATDLFEAAWYGGRDTGPDESARFRDLADRVLTGAGARR